MENSIQPRKQRKFRYNAPMHQRKKMVAVHVSKELKAKLGTARRSVPAHKGDRVKVMRGERKGLTGKILEVELNDLKVYVEGYTQKNAKGIEKLMPVDPSNLLLLEGEFSKDRLEMIQRSGKKKQ
ncbi:MAG: 50S ribosomal protein L24 [Candidatus Micrarchaeia archaeon]